MRSDFVVSRDVRDTVLESFADQVPGRSETHWYTIAAVDATK